MKEYLKIKGEEVLSKRYGNADVHFDILSSNSWPIQQQDSEKLQIPPLVARMHSDFETYYKSRN